MHKGNRDPTTSKKIYGEMAGPKGLRHIFSIFEHLALPGTQQKLGCTTSDTDVPMDAPAAYFKLLLDEDSEFLGEAMDFALPLAGLLLRRALWHQEGLPGYQLNWTRPTCGPPMNTKQK